jgi:succinate-semialdehyde dehydrogenase/glutarate-semialdehyde dehydrogenase
VGSARTPAPSPAETPLPRREIAIPHNLRLAALVSGITLSEGPREEITVIAPYTGAALGAIPAGRDSDIELAVGRARGAQPAWAGRSFEERARILLLFHDLLLERQNEVLDLIQLETGKARRHAFEELLDTAIVARYYALRAARLLRPRRRKGALPVLTSTWEVRVPIGVIGFISPWNYPLTLAITDAIPALLAGNTAVLKPDHQTSFTALWAVDLLRQAGLPPDVMPVVTGDGAVIGPSLVDRADFIMFTGSTRTGRIVARQAADRLIGCSLELGGKNPMLVLPDADLDRAVDGAVRGSFVGAGQVCISIERIYVHRSLYAPFLDRFVKRTEALRIGASLDYSMEVGSLASARQLETVEAHVRDAVEKGATLAAGGRRLPELGPFFYAPTILAGVRDNMRVFAEETFGPVVSVYPFETEQEAVDLANRTPYGLSASVWTRDAGTGLAVARRIRAGMVNVNEAYASAWASVDGPAGGMKESGIGRRHGAEGILKYTEAQTVAIQRLLPLAAPPGTAAATRYARVMTAMVRLLRRTRVMG